MNATASNPPTESQGVYDRNFLLAVVAQTCFVIANTLMAHYARWIEFLGGNLSQVGWIMGLAATFGIVVRPWMGQWISRLGARTTWMLGSVLFAVCSVANLTLSDLTGGIILIRSGLFLGTAIVFASSLTYVSQTAPLARRTEAIGILGTGGFLGMLVGPFLGDLILGPPSTRTHDDYGILFLFASAAAMIAIVLIAMLRKPSAEVSHPAVAPARFLATVRSHWPGTILLVDLVFGVCMAGPFVFVASYIDQTPLQIKGVSVIGLFFLFYAGFGLLVRVTFRRLPDRVGRRRILFLGGLFMSVGMCSFAIVGADSPWRIVIPGVLAGTGHGLMFHTMMSLTIEPFPRHAHGIGSTLALMMLDLGTLAGAPLLGQIGQHWGYSALFGTIGVLCFTSVGIYIVSRLIDQRTSNRDRAPRVVSASQPTHRGSVSDAPAGIGPAEPGVAVAGDASFDTSSK